ncbi:MAG: hypothetical protein IT528_04235 [Nitrosomonas sp.]|nr:hypothetical protein [Nitrosomonas sp.]MCC7135594.1 hypothetical protein [Nitrosomonas sp.]
MLLQKVLQTLATINQEIQRYQRSPVQVLQNWFTAYGWAQFSAYEIRLYGLADPLDGSDRLQHYVSKEMADRFYRKHNPVSAVANIEDKLRFTQLCLHNHLATPATHGLFHDGTIQRVDGTLLQTSVDWVAFVNALAPGEYLLKPNNGILGLGLATLEKHMDGSLIYQNQKLGVDDFFRTLTQIEASFASYKKNITVVDQDFQGILLQSRVKNHSDIMQLTGFNMLQTMRICTHVTADNQVEILFAFMKLAGSEGLADAFNLGKTGNMLAEIDPTNGRFRKIHAMDQQQGYLVQVDYHPVTLANLLEFTVPCWQTCKQLAEQAALAFLPLRAVGWDIAITDQGPMVLEGNENWVPVVPFNLPYEKLKLYGLKR